MSEDSDSKSYCFPVLEDQDGASGCRASTACSSMAQLHRMSGYSQGVGLPSEGSDSSSQDGGGGGGERSTEPGPRGRTAGPETTEIRQQAGLVTFEFGFT